MAIKSIIIRHNPKYLSLSCIIFVIFSLYLLGSCANKPEEIFKIATNVWPGYEPLYLARNLGWYDKSTIRLVEMPSASQVSHALLNGTVQAAALTLDETLSLIQDGEVDLRVILVMDISNGADVLLAKPEIQNLSALRSKRIGVENTATGAVVLDAALQAAQIAANEIYLVPITVDDHLAAWTNNQVDAIVTFEPVRSVIINTGARELFNSSQIPGRILDVLVVRADAIDGNQAVIKQLIKGFFSACDYLNQQPEDASRRMAPRLATEAQHVQPQFSGLKLPTLTDNQKWLSTPQALLIQSATDLVKLMQAHQLLQGNIKIDNLADARFLPETPK